MLPVYDNEYRYLSYYFISIQIPAINIKVYALKQVHLTSIAQL